MLRLALLAIGRFRLRACLGWLCISGPPHISVPALPWVGSVRLRGKLPRTACR